MRPFASRQWYTSASAIILSIRLTSHLQGKRTACRIGGTIQRRAHSHDVTARSAQRIGDVCETVTFIPHLANGLGVLVTLAAHNRSAKLLTLAACMGQASDYTLAD
jgi:hypothetical protein